jgi:hypothetical protein
MKCSDCLVIIVLLVKDKLSFDQFSSEFYNFVELIYIQKETHIYGEPHHLILDEQCKGICLARAVAGTGKELRLRPNDKARHCDKPNLHAVMRHCCKLGGSDF